MKKTQILYSIAFSLLLCSMTACSVYQREQDSSRSSAASEPVLESSAARVETVKEVRVTKEMVEVAETEILVAAAASLKNVYEEQLIPMVRKQYPEITVTGVYDSSGKLQSQIEEGLDIDIFMSASVKQMKALDEEGLIVSDTITCLLENQMVLIVPDGSQSGIKEFGDIVNAGAIALGDPASVPAGQYAQEALTSLGVWDSIQERVSFGTNVTEVLNQVAEVGIVYATDAAGMEGRVTVAAKVPEGSLKEKIIYPVAVVKGTGHKKEADCFVEFLKTERAMEVFRSYGFSDGTN